MKIFVVINTIFHDNWFYIKAHKAMKITDFFVHSETGATPTSPPLYKQTQTKPFIDCQRKETK
jgi:hypothetical protein